MLYWLSLLNGLCLFDWLDLLIRLSDDRLFISFGFSLRTGGISGNLVLRWSHYPWTVRQFIDFLYSHIFIIKHLAPFDSERLFYHVHFFTNALRHLDDVHDLRKIPLFRLILFLFSLLLQFGFLSVRLDLLLDVIRCIVNFPNIQLVHDRVQIQLIQIVLSLLNGRLSSLLHYLLRHRRLGLSLWYFGQYHVLLLYLQCLCFIYLRLCGSPWLLIQIHFQILGIELSWTGPFRILF